MNIPSKLCIQVRAICFTCGKLKTDILKAHEPRIIGNDLLDNIPLDESLKPRGIVAQEQREDKLAVLWNKIEAKHVEWKNLEEELDRVATWAQEELKFIAQKNKLEKETKSLALWIKRELKNRWKIWKR